MTTGARDVPGAGGPGRSGVGGAGVGEEPVTEPFARVETPSHDQQSHDLPSHEGPSGPAPDGVVPDEPLPPRRLWMLVALALGVLALDIATKAAIVATLHDGEKIPLLGQGVALVLVRNPGAAFSLATGMTWVLTLVALAVVVGIARYARRLRSRGWAVALGLVLGGAVGNLVDRFFRGPGPLEGHVVDFVSVGWWPVFNVADSAICTGGALLVILALTGRELDGTRTEPEYEPAPEPDPDNPMGLDPDDERIARRGRKKYPKNKWDPLPDTPRYWFDGSAESGTDNSADGHAADPDDDLVDEDDLLPNRPRHAANKWESG